MEESKLTVLVLIDFSNAFNAVDHDILLAILSHIGFSSSAREWFASYLQGRQQAVRVGPVISDWCTLVAGVPQGGILSPLLFSIFINLITSHIRCTYHLYADDLQIYAQSDVNDIEDAITELNSDLTRISDWSSKFGITVNPTKCQAIIVGSSRRLSTLDFNSLPPVNFNNAVIPYSATVKNLGLIIDSSLSWRPQVTEVSKKVINTLRCLYRLKNFLPVTTKVMLVQTLVLPILDYADVCYADASQELLNKLDRLLNNCIRFIFGLRKFDHVSSFRSQLKWLPLPLRRSFRILSMLFSILHDPFVPAYLKCKFQYQGDSHNRCLRSAENLTLHVPFCRTGFSHNSFTSNAVRLWNMLPRNIKEAKTKPIFKRLLWE